MCPIDAVNVIHNYIRDFYYAPSMNWDGYEFRKRSYQRWAAYEICDRISEHPTDSAIAIIENFMFEMYMDSCYSDSAMRTFIFQTAIETAENIESLFL